MVNNMDVRNMYVKVNDQVIDKPSRPNSALPQLHIAEPEKKKEVEPSTNVNLSEQGKEKSKQAQDKDHFESLRGGEVDGAAEGKDSGDKLEEKVKELQEQIAALQQELAQKQNEGSDEERVKQIESEIAVLQAQLMSLLSEKLQGKSS